MNNKFMNIIIKLIVIISMILGAIVIFFIFSNSSNGANETDKVEKEITYLDTKILMLMNSLNNINLQNYQVSISKIEEQSDSTSESESSGESQSSGNKSSMGGMEEESNEESSKTTGTESSKNEEKITVTKMEIETANGEDIKPDWKNMQAEAEMLSQAWSTIILDLYKTDVNSEDILSFSTTLDDIIINLDKNDKTMSAMYMAKLYSYLPKFFGTNQNNKILRLVIESKSHILNAYAYVETDNWDKIQEEIALSEQIYTELINDVDLIKEPKKYSINKAYILLEELKNSLGTKNKEVFYMKYKNAIEGLNWVE